jgi:hypothetical protein
MKLLILTLLTPFLLMAQNTDLDSLKINNMSINYKHPSGQGKIESFKVGIWIGKPSKKGGKSKRKEIVIGQEFYSPTRIEEIKVFKPMEIFDDISIAVVNGGLKIISDGSELFWEDPLHLIKDALGIEVKNFYLSLDPKDISLKSKPLNLSIAKDTFSFEDIYITCGQAKGSRDIGKILMETCTTKIHIESSKISFLLGNNGIKSIVDRLLVKNGHYPLVSIRDVDLIMATNFLTLKSNLYLTKKNKISFSMEAMVTFNEKAKTFEIIVDKIKLGRINTTKILLSLISKLKEDWLRVDKKAKTIYLDLSKM